MTPSTPICRDCGDEYDIRRARLGYQHCPECGAQRALLEIAAKAKRTAPLYNKGGYQYLGDDDDARNTIKDINRAKGDLP